MMPLVGDFLTWILDSIQTVDMHTRLLIAMIGAMLEANVVLGLFIPGDTAVVLAAMAIGSPLEGVLLALLVAIGSVVGMASSYALGRWLGPRAASSWVARLVGRDRWARAELFLERRGSLAVFLARFLPIFRTLVPFLVGVGSLPLRKFLISASAASVLWSAGYVVVLSTASEQLRALVGTGYQRDARPLISEEVLGLALVSLVVVSTVIGLVAGWRRTATRVDVPRESVRGDDSGSGDENS